MSHMIQSGEEQSKNRQPQTPEAKAKVPRPFLRVTGYIAMSGLMAMGIIRSSIDYAAREFKQSSKDVLDDAQTRGGQLMVDFNAETVDPFKLEVRGVKEKAGTLADKLPERNETSTSTSTTTMSDASANSVLNEVQVAGNTVIPAAPPTSTTTTTAPPQGDAQP